MFTISHCFRWLSCQQLCRNKQREKSLSYGKHKNFCFAEMRIKKSKTKWKQHKNMFRSLFGCCRFFVDFFIVSFFRRCCQLLMGNNMHALHNFHTRNVCDGGDLCVCELTFFYPSMLVTSPLETIEFNWHLHILYDNFVDFFLLNKREIMFNVSKRIYLQWKFHSFVLDS